jgi:glucokinase
MKKFAIGIDIGGSHVSCAACDINEQKYLPETLSENDLDNQDTKENILSIWAKTIQTTIQKVGIENLLGIGFAMPGPFDYANGVALFKGNNKKYESLYGVNVPFELQRLLQLPESFPIRFINDATAFAIGEDWIGKTAGYKRSLAITLGTGFGSAFLADRLPVVSGDEVPESGCVWHLPFENGNADDYFSTRGFLNRYFEKTGTQLPGVKELADKVASDPMAQELFNDFGSNLGRFLHPWMERFRVEVLVMGGNISLAYHLFGDAMKNYLSNQGSHVKIEISELKESAAMIGSSVLIDQPYYDKMKNLLPLMS